MHELSMTNMQRCLERHGDKVKSQTGERVKMIDIGALNVTGSYAQLFPADRFEYLGVDMVAGEGVDLVLDDPYVLPFNDGSFDLAISGQMLEHNKFFWRSFREIFRVLRAGGMCFMIAPSRGDIHRYPTDCYRFYPDAYQAMAEYCDAVLVDCWIATEGPWGDLTGVFVKPDGSPPAAFDTHQITEIGGPAERIMEVAYRASAYEKQRDAARSKCDVLEAELNTLRAELERVKQAKT